LYLATYPHHHEFEHQKNTSLNEFLQPLKLEQCTKHNKKKPPFGFSIVENQEELEKGKK
jgi:hypothetical protein